MGTANEIVCYGRQGVARQQVGALTLVREMIKLSIIIVSYQKIEIIRDCLNSIEQYNDIGDALEVIVSDNSPDNKLFDTIKEEYPWVRLIKNQNNGFGAGNNRGYELSHGKYLLFLNPDTILVEPIFRFAVTQFENDPNLGLFGIQLLKKNLKRNYSFFLMDKYGICSVFLSRFYHAINHFQDGKMFIAGADLFVRRESFEQAGHFDENIFMYKEEADLIKRIKMYAIAKKTGFFKQKKLIHLEGGSEDFCDNRRLVVAQRIVRADRYYCKKYDISFAKVLRQRIRQAQFKYCIYILMDRKRAKVEKSLIQLFKSELEKQA